MTKENLAFIRALRDKGVEVTFSKPDKTVDSFYKNPAAMGSNASYPYRTLQDPSYGDIRINPPQYDDGIIHPIRLEKRYGPSNVTPEMMQGGDVESRDKEFLNNLKFAEKYGGASLEGFRSRLIKEPGITVTLPDSTMYDDAQKILNYVNSSKNEAAKDSTDYNANVDFYNNLFANPLIVEGHDPHASVLNPLSKTPTTDLNTAFRLQDNIVQARRAIHQDFRSGKPKTSGRRKSNLIHTDYPYYLDDEDDEVSVDTPYKLAKATMQGKNLKNVLSVISPRGVYEKFSPIENPALYKLEVKSPKETTTSKKTAEVKKEKPSEISKEKPKTMAVPRMEVEKRPATGIKMPDGSVMSKENFIKRYGQKVWDEQNRTPELQGGLVESKVDNTATSLNLIPDNMFTPLTQQEINQRIQKEQQQAYQESLKQARVERGKEFVQQSMEDIQDHPLWTLPASLSPLGAEEILTTQALKQGKKLATPLSNTAKKAYKGITEYIPDEWGFTGQPLPEDLQKTSNELFSMLDTPRGRMRLKGNYGLSDDQIENLFAVEEQLSSGTLADFTGGMISINPNLPKGLQRTAWRHELEHAARWAQGLDYNKPISEMYIDQLKLIDPEIPSGYVASDVIKKGKQVDTNNWQEIFTDLPSAREYIKKPEEAGSFAAEVKQYMLDKGLAKSSFDKFTPEMVEQAYNMYQADKSIPLRLFNLLDPAASKSNYDKMAKAFNRMMAITGVGSTTAITSQKAPELKQGGMERQKFSKEDLSFMRALRDRGVEVTFSGYKNDSPDKNNSANLIPSGNITMENVDKPVFAMDSKGNSTVMQPGQNYQFRGNAVLEIPMMQGGGPESPNYDASTGYIPAPYSDAYTQSNAVVSPELGDGSAATGGSMEAGTGFGMSDALAIGAGVSNISQSLAQLGPESSTEVGSVSGMGGSREQAVEGTIGGTLSSIPIVGQFYQIGAGIGKGFEAGANAFYAEGNEAGGEAMTALQGAVDPSSQWGRNAELWEAGYLSDSQAIGNFIGGFFGFGGGPGMDRKIRDIKSNRFTAQSARATGGLHTTPAPSAESASKFSKATGYPKAKRT